MTIKIYFSDLVPETQAEMLAAANIFNPKDANWDIFPLFELEIETDRID